MYSENECGICYQIYNAGRRCPRELHCKHSFCESCLLALSRPLGADEARLDRTIVCPMCRHPTIISGEGKVRAELRADESVLLRLIVTGLVFQDEDQEEKEDQESCDNNGELPEIPAERSDLSAGSRGGRLRRSCRKVWKLISGKNSSRSSGENYMTNADLRNFAMMSCYMF
ncbi:E3 ubiquitin-protein ligase-like [Plectropomus leopardus]|uniref:E3 ubiquitin-protein ligase-like n=1 Tax=Plectropomus leopardus TaxID=160734 RepID=UPI001C4DD614|nr:E3 ubiquitin-protein ligase-like [Plectropomus leopardus]